MESVGGLTEQMFQLYSMTAKAPVAKSPVLAQQALTCCLFLEID
jgi:hypothetical protein